MLWDWELGWKEPGSSADSSVCGSLVPSCCLHPSKFTLQAKAGAAGAGTGAPIWDVSIANSASICCATRLAPCDKLVVSGIHRGCPLSTHQQPADCCPHPSFPRVNWEPALGEEDVSPSFRCMAKGHDPTLGSHFPFQAEPQVSTRFGQEMERSGQTS